MNKFRVRFGVKNAIVFLPNAAVFVRWMNQDSFDKLSSAIETARQALTMSGNTDLAEKLVCEKS